MNEPLPPAPTQASLPTIKVGIIRNAIQENIQPDSSGVIAPFSFKPPGGVSGLKRVRIANYTPYVFTVVGVPGGGSGDPPQLLQPFQQNVWNYEASRGEITLNAAQDDSPLAVPPLRFAYSAGTATGDLLFNYVTVEWTDTPDLFFGYYPVDLGGVAITAEALRVTNPLPTVIPVGTDPVAVAVDAARQRAYVVNATSQTISVIDTATQTVMSTVTMSHTPTDVAVNTVTGRVYVTFSDEPNIGMFDGDPLAHIGNVAVGDNQVGITVDPTTNKKYASLVGGNVAVLDATDVHTGNVVVAGTLAGIAHNTVTGQVYVAVSSTNRVVQIDEATDVVVGIPIVLTGTVPKGIECDSLTNRIYVACSTSDTVSDIDGATALETASIAVGTDPVAVAIDATTSKVYVADNGANSVSVIDEGTDTVVDTLAPGVGPVDVAVNETTNKVFVVIAADAVVVLNGV